MPLVFEEIRHSALVEAYIKNVFIKAIKKEKVVMIDSISFHKIALSRDTNKSRQFIFVYLVF
ncbi:hypothetical protein HCUR_00695 [Holospora curviuscula]|uniref:Uncharacterized protein n=2 Tax=Holospora curviuscula TaxID=1082868 RepID=A0A2S5R9V4_9PROT|nr:hypothetical protein HCUR_00695 [Holospora curviuscula]